MPNDAAEGAGAEMPGWDRLEASVRKLLDEHDALRARVAAAERRAGELGATLRDVSAGHLDPTELAERVEALQRENRALGERLTQARETVERLLARMRFVEEGS